jgi:hypothetical protein
MVAQTAAQPVELPYDECVAVFEFLNGEGQSAWSSLLYRPSVHVAKLTQFAATLFNIRDMLLNAR